MGSSFLAVVSKEVLEEKLSGSDEEVFEFLAEPIHEELYKKQDFTFIDELSEAQQLLMSYDYTRMQVLQGGFIQMIQNGYIGILPNMPDWLNNINDKHMAKTIDDVLKVYVLNRELLDKETSVEEFAKLYDELQEFQMLDEQFVHQNEDTIHLIVENAKAHLEDFIKIA
jgi:hypothetical protein